MHSIGGIKYFLANISGHRPIDVIATQSPVVESALKEYCDGHNIRCIEVDPLDAATVLHEQGGVGMGVYLHDNNACPATLAIRKMDAAIEALRLSVHIGPVDIAKPIAVLDTEVIKEHNWLKEACKRVMQRNRW